MQKITTLPALCVVSAMLLAEVPAFAQDPAAVQTDAAPPSGREVSILAEETKRSPQKPAEAARDNDTQESLCLMIESAARANELPLEFFARVIWQESRFQSDAVGPVTRSGKRAQGIAQFMPKTAVHYGLINPFEPIHALNVAARFLQIGRAHV